MIVEFDTNQWKTLRAKDKAGAWHTLTGKCLRCGRCGCLPCDYFAHEVVDGKRIGKCLRQFEKPFMCAIYPYDPTAELKDGCGFRWE